MIRSIGLILALTILCGLNACAQRTIKVQGLQATVSLGNDLSLRQARQKAEQELQLEALRKAGISEHIQAYESLMQFQNGENLDQVFISDIQNDVQGIVSKLEVLNIQQRINRAGEFEISLTAKAEVMPGKGKSDPNFNFTIEGIRTNYIAGDALAFVLTPSQNAYVQVFLINENNMAHRLYPNYYEREEPVIAQTRVSFPRRSVDYRLATEKKGYEYYRLVVLMTKSAVDLPISLNPNDKSLASEIPADKLMQLLYQIDQGERRLYFQSFKVEQN
jgi:hypothetical protein